MIKENDILIMYADILENYDYNINENNIEVTINEIVEDSILQVYLSGIPLTDGIDYSIDSSKITLNDRDETYLLDNFSVYLYK